MQAHDRWSCPRSGCRAHQVLARAGKVTTAEERRRLVTAIVDVVGDAGPQVVVLLSDPAVGAHLREVTGNSPLVSRCRGTSGASSSSDKSRPGRSELIPSSVWDCCWWTIAS